MYSISQFRIGCARLFDDKNKDGIGYKIVDYSVLFFIILNTLEVFLLTFPKTTAKYQTLLAVIDGITTAFFTAEVTLRIWTCGCSNPKYKGFQGMLHYCFSFKGIIDIIAAYPALFCFNNFALMRYLRLFRIMRIFRFLRSFEILISAAKAKRKEIVVSLQFLVIITLILSLVLFFVEHDAQPQNFHNVFQSVIWAFTQYINGVGNITDAELSPITNVGKIIAFIIGILTIAIVAVPAGLIGSAFIEVMEEDKKARQIKKNIIRLERLFLLKSIRINGNYNMPVRRFTLEDLQLYTHLDTHDIWEAVDNTDNLRIMNLSASIDIKQQNSLLVLNYVFRNTKYGSCINRKSNVTIVIPCGDKFNELTYFSFHIAQLGGFNYVSNEVYSSLAENLDNRTDFFIIKDVSTSTPAFQKYESDILNMAGESENWIIVMVGVSFIKNSEALLHFHFGGRTKLFDTYAADPFNIPTSTVHDTALLKKFYNDFSQYIFEKIGYKTDVHKTWDYGPTFLTNYLHTKTPANVVTLIVANDPMVWHTKGCNSLGDNFDIIKTIAEVINRNLETKKPVGLQENWYHMPLYNHYKDDHLEISTD